VRNVEADMIERDDAAEPHRHVAHGEEGSGGDCRDPR
jgi:hypothetical protein